MPVVLTFDIKGATTSQLNRIQSFFQRFGWENLGGSAYRYPRLGTNEKWPHSFRQKSPMDKWKLGLGLKA
jgi:hypothetical protein